MSSCQGVVFFSDSMEAIQSEVNMLLVQLLLAMIAERTVAIMHALIFCCGKLAGSNGSRDLQG